MKVGLKLGIFLRSRRSTEVLHIFMGCLLISKLIGSWVRLHPILGARLEQDDISRTSESGLNLNSSKLSGAAFIKREDFFPRGKLESKSMLHSLSHLAASLTITFHRFTYYKAIQTFSILENLLHLQLLEWGSPSVVDTGIPRQLV